MPHIYDISTGNCYVESQKREGARPGEKKLDQGHICNDHNYHCILQ